MDITAIGKAKVQLITKSPFWAVLVLNTPIIETATPPFWLPPGQPWTACTDGKTIWVNHEWAGTLPAKQVMFLLAHEAGHIMFEHCNLGRIGNRDANVWRLAADYVINHLLTEDGMEFIPGGLLDSRYTTSTEEVYEQLLKDGAESDSPGGIGPDLIPGNMTPADAAEHSQKVKQLVAQAATVARMSGKLSAPLARLVGDMLAPPMPWPDLLRHYMQQVSRDEESWSRRNRRFSSAYMPGNYSLRLGPICVIVDTSGSITEDDLSLAISEIRAVADLVRPESIRVLGADTTVRSEQVLEQGDEVTVSLRGGGGTNMCVPLAYVEQYGPCVVILITDGYTPWPDSEPPYPLIVCCTTDEVPPVGQLVRIAP